MASRLQVLALGGALALVIAGGGVTVAVAQMSGEQVVKERSDLMKGISENNKILVAAVKSGEIDAKAAKAAEEISASAKKIPALFPAGTGDDKLRTRAKPAIWQEQAKFLGYAKDAETNFAAMAKAATAGDKSGAEAAFTKASEACSACHKEFRGPALK
jgi:cytochrome c556